MACGQTYSAVCSCRLLVKSSCLTAEIRAAEACELKEGALALRSFNNIFDRRGRTNRLFNFQAQCCFSQKRYTMAGITGVGSAEGLGAVSPLRV